MTPGGRTVRRADVDTVIYGDGCLLDDPVAAIRELAGLKRPRVAIVCTARLAAGDLTSRLSAGLETAVLVAAPHAPWPWLRETAAAFTASPPDVVLGYGSGAAIDSAKLLREQAVRHASTAADLVSAVAQDHAPDRARPLLVAVPTTLSGAAFTCSAGVTVHGSGNASRKLVAKAPALVADAAMLDPGLCSAAASDVWVSTGFKAVEHAVESIYSPAANVVTTTLCGQGLRLLAQSLQVGDSRTSEQALDCLLASWLVLLGRGNITFGPSHAIGHQLGGVLGVRHGLTAAAVLPSVMRLTEQHVAPQQRAAVDAAGLDAEPGREDRRPWEAIQAWAQRLGLPASVRELGVDPGELKALAPAVAADMSRESGTAWLDRIGGGDGVARLLEDVW